MRFCLCIFESDTVKSDGLMQDLNIYRLLVYFTSLTICSGDIKKKSAENREKKKEKKALKMTSQLVIFRAFFPVPDL